MKTNKNNDNSCGLRLRLEIELMQTYGQAMDLPFNDEKVIDAALSMSDRLEQSVKRFLNEDPLRLLG